MLTYLVVLKEEVDEGKDTENIPNSASVNQNNAMIKEEEEEEGEIKPTTIAAPTFVEQTNELVAPKPHVLSGVKKKRDLEDMMICASKLDDVFSGRENNDSNVDLFQKRKFVVPDSVYEWFSSKGIHQIERDGVPEFFQGHPSKTPELYKKYRNFMIEMYANRPQDYLSAIVCRRSLCGDVCAIIRLHTFLDSIGLINFAADQSTRPQSILNVKQENFANLGPSFCGSNNYLPPSKSHPRLQTVKFAPFSCSA